MLSRNLDSPYMNPTVKMKILSENEKKNHRVLFHQKQMITNKWQGSDGVYVQDSEGRQNY